MNNKLITFAVLALIVLCSRHASLAEELDCTSIIHVSNDSIEAKVIEIFLENYLSQGRREKSEISFRTLERAGNWIVAEIDVSNLEPGIIVLERAKTSYRIAAAFGGRVPEEPEKFIRAYFLEEVPNAPKELFQCYEPIGEPFHREK